jgi:hypothetical protein
MRLKTLGLAAAATMALLSTAEAAPRAVLELFTSPFCSSCPPADELFVKLARQPDLITLVMPVDSYDRPGRKDPLASAKFSDRQSAYAEMRKEDMVYTPEAIVNGAAPTDGADSDEIAQAIAQTNGVISVPVKATPLGQDLLVSVGAGTGPGAKSGAMITVLPYVASRAVPMRGGETLHYANLVRDIVPLGRWSGAPVKQRIALTDYADCDGVVVLVQAGTPERPGAIIGATRVPLHERPKA